MRIDPERGMGHGGRGNISVWVKGSGNTGAVVCPDANCNFTRSTCKDNYDNDHDNDYGIVYEYDNDYDQTVTMTMTITITMTVRLVTSHVNFDILYKIMLQNTI